MLVSDLARTLAASPCVVHFIKADGTPRRMLTAPAADGVTVRSGAVRVFDAEKGAWRSICAERVVSVTSLNARPPSRLDGAYRAHVAPSHADTLAAIADDFRGGFVTRRRAA